MQTPGKTVQMVEALLEPLMWQKLLTASLGQLSFRTEGRSRCGEWRRPMLRPPTKM
jgi:hypothetical protein